ncbi:MAG: hypothetical protein FWG37_00740 [Clostridia bacterium]|nr:hypothetical protein [Clostridia bacterium]
MSQIKRTVRACRSLFRIRFAEELQYRAAAIAGASIGIFWAIIEITVYTAFYTYGTARTNASLTLSQLLSYAWLTQIIYSISYIDIDGELRQKITGGDISVELCQPMDFYVHWFTKTAAGRLGGSCWRMLFTLIAGLAMPASYRLGGPSSAAGFALFILSMFSAFLLAGAYSMLVTAVRIGITWGEGPTHMLSLLGMVLGGGYLPLQLWPDFMQRALFLQPFAGYIDIPVRLYIGSLAPADALPAIGLQLFWTAIFILAGKMLTKRKLNRLIVQGG